MFIAIAITIANTIAIANTISMTMTTNLILEYFVAFFHQQYNVWDDLIE